MGLSNACAFATCTDLETGLCLSSIGLPEDDGAKTLVRSISFKNQDSEQDVIKSFTRKIPSPKETRLVDPKQNKICTESSPKHESAIKLQKVYKSFRTGRKLADCAVLTEQSWWKLLDSEELKRSSISFFHSDQHESALSRWARAKTRAAKVGKGLSKNCKAQKLELQHWLEAIDPRHRYGHNLHFYYLKWKHSQSKEPFFYWLDIGEGKEVNLVEKCPRSKLQQQCIKYLDPIERQAYEVAIENGKLLCKQTGELIDTTTQTNSAKWIFVLSTTKTLYVGIKKKGSFQHSSFLSGGATLAAGRIIAEKGVLKAVWPHSGHYRPTRENFQDFISFLQENEVDTSNFEMDLNDEDDNEYFGKQSSIAHLRTHSSEEDNILDKPVEEERNPDSFIRRLNVLEIPKNDDLLVNFENKTTETMQDCYSDDEHEHEHEHKRNKIISIEKIDFKQMEHRYRTSNWLFTRLPFRATITCIKTTDLSPARRNIHPCKTKSLPQLNVGSMNLVRSCGF